MDAGKLLVIAGRRVHLTQENTAAAVQSMEGLRIYLDQSPDSTFLIRLAKPYGLTAYFAM